MNSLLLCPNAAFGTQETNIRPVTKKFGHKVD